MTAVPSSGVRLVSAVSAAAGSSHTASARPSGTLRPFRSHALSEHLRLARARARLDQDVGEQLLADGSPRTCRP